MLAVCLADNVLLLCACDSVTSACVLTLDVVTLGCCPVTGSSYILDVSYLLESKRHGSCFPSVPLGSEPMCSVTWKLSN